MTRIKQAQKIIDFFVKYRLFSNTDNMKAENIARYLDSSWFIEHLIQELIVKAKYRENIDMNELNDLIDELENTRLELEYQDQKYI